VRFSVIVYPGSKREAIGGDYAGSLMVRVQAPAVDAKANLAALALIAKTFEVPKASVQLLVGQTSRRKVLEIRGSTPAHEAKLALLLATPAR
jgi:uncharacterized protein